ncbi:MAG: hypothetical protein KAH33_07470, partial [Candidatus Delongbacteria bacterium]|nr:hypothetical protein [Candidatus Delongbacteria bacterium]
IAVICISDDAFVFMVDDISVDNAKGETVFTQSFDKGREVLRTPVSKTSYSGVDSPQAEFSPAVTRDIKSNLTGFKVYRNSNYLATIYNPLDLTYFDADLANGSYSYNVTATYSDPVQESDPSTTKFVTVSNEYVIDSFPWNESFEKLTFAPDEWEIQSTSANTWAETTRYTIGETTVSPIDGSKFAYVNWIAEDQDEWLVTPLVDLSSIGTPELSFWFNGSYYYSVDPEPNAMLTVYQSVDGDSWTEIWKASDHTGFDADYINYSWLETTLPIGSEGIVQFAFVYAGNDGANFAIDDITINGTPKALKNSVVDTGNGLEMHLSWNYVAGATSYHIYRSSDAYNNFERIGTTTSNYFVDDTVGDSKMFFYYLTADNAKK